MIRSHPLTLLYNPSGIFFSEENSDEESQSHPNSNPSETSHQPSAETPKAETIEENPAVDIIAINEASPADSSTPAADKLGDTRTKPAPAAIAETSANPAKPVDKKQISADQKGWFEILLIQQFFIVK